MPISGVIGTVTKTPLSIIIGANVKHYREAKGISQGELARMAMLKGGQPYISGIESGSRNLSIQSLERIAAALGQPAITLLVKLSG